MSEMPARKPNYRNWVSAKLLYIPGEISILLAGLSVVLPVLIVICCLVF